MSRVWIIGENGRIEQGYFRVRLVKDGPMVPAHVWIEPSEIEPVTGHPMTDERLHVVIDCIERDRPALGWQPLIGERITEREYRYMVAASQHATAHEPNLPAADPYSPVDLATAPSPF